MIAFHTNWACKEITALCDLPFDDPDYQAATVHHAHHAVGQILLCAMLSLNTCGKLLTAANAGGAKDAALMAKLGLVPMEVEEPLRACMALEAAA